MKALFDAEAKRNNVFPLDDRMKMERFLAASAQQPKRSHYTYWGAGISTPTVVAAPLVTRSFRITADLVLPDTNQTAPIVAAGSQFGGWSFYLDNGKPVALVAASQRDRDQHRVSASQPQPAGRTTLTFDFRYDGGVNAGGEMIISANGAEIGRGRIAATISKYPEMTDTLDIGFDADTPVTSAYPMGSRFAGTIARVDIAVGQPGKPGSAPAEGTAQ